MFATLPKNGAKVADALAALKPKPYGEGDSYGAWRRSDWYTTVRSVADALYTRPDYSYPMPQSMERWIAFTNRAGYLT